nr:MAG TPA: hypothetical protein [Caudoviricetes sp.]
MLFVYSKWFKVTCNMSRTQHNTKKVYRQRHAEAKAKACKRDKFKNKLNPLDYVEDPSVYDQGQSKG